MEQSDLLKICDPKQIIPNFELSPTCVCDVEKLWEIVLKNPVPLFKTVDCDPTLAIFENSKLSLSEEAKKLTKIVPQVYIARLESENAYYIGKSDQPGGRWKRGEDHHLGKLARAILSFPKECKYSNWVRNWFKFSDYDCWKNCNKIPLKEKVIITFLHSEKEEFKDQLENYEFILGYWALKKGKTLLNKELCFNIDRVFPQQKDN